MEKAVDGSKAAEKLTEQEKTESFVRTDNLGKTIRGILNGNIPPRKERTGSVTFSFFKGAGETQVEKSAMYEEAIQIFQRLKDLAEAYLSEEGITQAQRDEALGFLDADIIQQFCFKIWEKQPNSKEDIEKIAKFLRNARADADTEALEKAKEGVAIAAKKETREEPEKPEELGKPELDFSMFDMINAHSREIREKVVVGNFPNHFDEEKSEKPKKKPFWAKFIDDGDKK